MFRKGLIFLFGVILRNRTETKERFSDKFGVFFSGSKRLRKSFVFSNIAINVERAPSDVVSEAEEKRSGQVVRQRHRNYLDMLFLLGFSEVDSRREAEERRRDNFRSFFSFCLRASSLAYSLASAFALAIRVRFWALTRLA